MQKIIILILCFVVFKNLFAQQNNLLYIASYNMENLFDTIDDPNKNDEEFTPEGKKEWTEEKLSQKMYNLARVIRSINNLNGPDILGVQEVENQAVLQKFIDEYFCDKNYQIAYAEAPDKRGIDCGLIYNETKFKVNKITPIEVILDDKYPTRLILHITLSMINNDEILNVFVNHWPSRRGGEEKSEPNRLRASETLQKSLEEILNDDKQANIVIMGDFNDMPDNNSITSIANADLYPCYDGIELNSDFYNLSIKNFDSGNGTYSYKGNWNMLDQIIVSKSMITDEGIKYKCNSFEIIKPEFIIQKDGNYKGSSLPTFGGRKYFGGFSDHYAVGASFIIN